MNPGVTCTAANMPKSPVIFTESSRSQVFSSSSASRLAARVR